MSGPVLGELFRQNIRSNKYEIFYPRKVESQRKLSLYNNTRISERK